MPIHAGSLLLGVSCMDLNPAHFLIFSVRLLCNGPCGNWAQGLPHAERVWYHYTNHHQPTLVPDLLPLFGILLCPFRHAFGPQTEFWCHGAVVWSCLTSFLFLASCCPFWVPCNYTHASCPCMPFFFVQDRASLFFRASPHKWTYMQALLFWVSHVWTWILPTFL